MCLCVYAVFASPSFLLVLRYCVVPCADVSHMGSPQVDQEMPSPAHSSSCPTPLCHVLMWLTWGSRRSIGRCLL